jgi:phosphatidylserine/phosphatidylglycerophosphate/cardiolipin synthase-like enzyme
MMKDGWSTAQLATLLVSIADAQEAASRPEAYLDIVLSGPEIAGVPTRNTAAVISSIVSKAEREVLLVGYAVYNGKKLFEPIARRMEELPGIDVKFILNIPRSRHDTSLKDGILQRFMADFYKKNWPWEARPTVYYDPRALELEWTQRASLHAKCVVVDREVALVTSANFTEAAQTKNVETGVIVTYRPFARRIADYFDGLISTHLKRLP